MNKCIELRRKIRNQEIPLRQISREDGIHRQTLRKIRDNSQPPGYQRTKPIQKSKIGPYIDRIKAIIEADKTAIHKKQYHTAKKIWEILQSDGLVLRSDPSSVAVASVRPCRCDSMLAQRGHLPATAEGGSRYFAE